MRWELTEQVTLYGRNAFRAQLVYVSGDPLSKGYWVCGNSGFPDLVAFSDGLIERYADYLGAWWPLFSAWSTNWATYHGFIGLSSAGQGPFLVTPLAGTMTTQFGNRAGQEIRQVTSSSDCVMIPGYGSVCGTAKSIVVDEHEYWDETKGPIGYTGLTAVYGTTKWEVALRSTNITP
jgi:hypothetical protein